MANVIFASAQMKRITVVSVTFKAIQFFRGKMALLRTM